MNHTGSNHRSLLKGLVLLTTLVASDAWAAERQVRGGFAVQMNPLGLRGDVEVNWRWRLFNSTNPLLKDAHVAMGISDQVTPASNQAQAWLEVSPLSILDIRAGAGGVLYFGTFGNLVGFEGYERDFSDHARRVLRDQAVSRTGRRYFVSPSVKFRAGRVSVRSTADFESWRVKDAPGRFFYEPNRGTLLDARGDSLVNGSSVLLVDASRDGNESLRVGVLHDYLKVWDAPENIRQRVGPMALIKVGANRRGGRDPLVSLAVLKYLDAPNRSGLGGLMSLSFALGRGARR